MTKITIEVPDVIARRLDALSSVSGKSVDELAREGLDSLRDRGRRDEPS